GPWRRRSRAGLVDASALSDGRTTESSVICSNFPWQTVHFSICVSSEERSSGGRSSKSRRFNRSWGGQGFMVVTPIALTRPLLLIRRRGGKPTKKRKATFLMICRTSDLFVFRTPGRIPFNLTLLAGYRASDSAQSF